jgi:hypothetical protein
MNYQVLGNILKEQNREFTYSDENGYEFICHHSKDVKVQVAFKQYKHLNKLKFCGTLNLEEDTFISLGIIHNYLNDLNQQFDGCITIDKTGVITYRETTFLPGDSETVTAFCRHALELFEVTVGYLYALITLEQMRAKFVTDGLKYRSFELPQKRPEISQISQLTRTWAEKIYDKNEVSKVMQKFDSPKEV